MLEIIVMAVIGLVVGGAVVASFRGAVRDTVAAWLRGHGLADSALMDAWILLQDVESRIRVRLRLATRELGTRTVEVDRIFSIDEIDDEELRAALKRGKHVERRMMDLLE